jgi:hypothetical protein
MSCYNMMYIVLFTMLNVTNMLIVRSLSLYIYIKILGSGYVYLVNIINR